MAFRVWQREVTLYRRIWPSTILSNLFDPLIYLLAMGFGLGAFVAAKFNGVSYVQFIAPGLVASAIMMAATYEVAWNSYVRIHHERSYEAMMSTPATLEDVVAGEIAWAMTRSAIYATVMLVVLAALRLVASPWALLIPLVALAGGAIFAVVGLAYTSLVKHMDQLTFYFTLFTTPMFLFSGIFFPVDTLPLPLRALAYATPLYHLVAVTRALILGGVGLATVGHLAVLLVAAAALFPLPVVVLRKKLVH
ncbi:MAG: ABC transporter permease [Thermoplasmatota archaeon]